MVATIAGQLAPSLSIIANLKPVKQAPAVPAPKGHRLPMACKNEVSVCPATLLPERQARTVCEAVHL
jgi:hypothetical protein